MPIYINDWHADYPDPHDFIYNLYASVGAFPKQQGFYNPALDRLIQDALRTLDPVQRARLYEKIQRIAHQDAPSLLTVYSDCAPPPLRCQ